MAKAPRRPGRDRGGRRKGNGDAPPPVKPVVPPRAQPVKPVRPVQPVKPAVAKPVRPVKPAAAKPVQPVTPAAAPAGKSRRRAAEEEIGGRRGSSRSAAPHHEGMSFPLKAALVAGGATLLVMAVAVLLGGGNKDDAEASFNEAGYAAAQALAGTNPLWWTGTAATKTDAVVQARQIVTDLFDVEGREFWDLRAAEVEQPISDEMDLEDRQELQAAKQRWADTVDKYGGDSSKDTSGRRRDADKRMGRIVDSKVAEAQHIQIYGAWIREASGSDSEGAFIASTPDPKNIAYDWSKAKDFAVDGRVGGQPVRIFGAAMDNISSGAKRKSVRAYVALWSGGLGGRGDSDSVGLAMLLLGPLLVGGIAFALAGAHAKNVKALAREIDRLGTSGDATRALRAQGSEAASVARSVERMVGNLEFRQKHGDDDLDVIVEKEREVADEIHGALMAKNPPRLSDYEVETLFKPGFEIGGDHFEYFRIDDDHLGVILLDTNVRGITAALVMASARSYVRSVAPGVLSPAEVLRKVNRSLAGDLPAGRHVTALYVVIDTREGKATIASAGHLPLIVYRHATGKVAKVNPEGIALGLDVGPIFDRSLQEGDIPIGVGDRIVLYTDGALQIQDTDGDEFGEARFYQAVSKEAPKNSQAFVNFVGSAIDQFHAGTQQNDDITISTVKRLK